MADGLHKPDELKLKRTWGCNHVWSIKEAVCKACDGNDYGVGSVEAAGRTAEQTAQFVGQLVEVLHERSVLSKDEVLALLPGFEEHI